MAEVYYSFLLSIAIILLVARLTGEFFDRYLKQSSVLGELIAGIVISPFALGGLLFPNNPILLNFGTIDEAFGLGEFRVMELLATLAIVILLFHAGTETDVREFVRVGFGGASVALGGVLVPFILGYLVMIAFGFTFVAALFMGAVLTATSIGITVRVLMDLGKLRDKEGTTILVAAVIDDIISLIVLALVVGIASGTASLANLASIGAVAFISWFLILMVGLKFSRQIKRIFLTPFKATETSAIMALIVGLFIAYALTLAGLHPVIGAYAAGLMFAATGEGEEIAKSIKPIVAFLAPLFFVYLGMQVNLTILIPVLGLVAAIAIVALVSKVVGCYIPARFVSKLSHKSSLIVGVGMIPRGEVGLIIAGAGLAAGAVSEDLFGVAVIVSIISTLVVPPILKYLTRPVASRQV